MTEPSTDEREALREEILEAIAANESMPIGAEGAMRRAERTLDLYALAARPAVDVEGIARVVREFIVEEVGFDAGIGMDSQAAELTARIVAYLAGESRDR